MTLRRSLNWISCLLFVSTVSFSLQHFFSVLRWQLGIRLQNICKKTNKQRNNNNNKDSLERYLVCCLQWSEGDAKKLQSEPARSRTWNLLIRSQMRYPLRHWPTSCWVLCFHKSCLFWTCQRPELLLIMFILLRGQQAVNPSLVV